MGDEEIHDKIVRVRQTRAGGAVERLHTVRHTPGYTNAAHSWGVAMLLYELFPVKFEELVIYALCHDVPEAWTGDIPGTVLRYWPDLKSELADVEASLNWAQCGLPSEKDLEGEDLAILKACDILELYIYCWEEHHRGNRFITEVLVSIETAISEHPLPEPAMSFWQAFRLDYVQPRQAGVMKEIMYECQR